MSGPGLERRVASSDHRRLLTPAFPELRATCAPGGRLNLELFLGGDAFCMKGVSLVAAQGMFSAQVRGGALWASTRSLRDAARADHPEVTALSLRPDHRGLSCRFVLSEERGGQLRELDPARWGEALAALAWDGDLQETAPPRLAPPSAIPAHHWPTVLPYHPVYMTSHTLQRSVARMSENPTPVNRHSWIAYLYCEIQSNGERVVQAGSSMTQIMICVSDGKI